MKCRRWANSLPNPGDQSKGRREERDPDTFCLVKRWEKGAVVRPGLVSRIGSVPSFTAHHLIGCAAGNEVPSDVLRFFLFFDELPDGLGPSCLHALPVTMAGGPV